MAQRIMKLVILGAPGSGKGTIASRIARDFDVKSLSSGDLLRSQIAMQTGIGIQAKKFTDKGQLVPDDVVTALVTEELKDLKNVNWLLDGFPRTKKQAENLQDVESISLAINMDIPSEVIMERIRGRWTHLPSGRIYHVDFNPPRNPGKDDVTGEPLVQREDDKAEVVTRRLEIYKASFTPILEFYRSQDILQEFHGRESNEIWPRIHSFLSRYMPPRSGPF